MRYISKFQLLSLLFAICIISLNITACKEDTQDGLIEFPASTTPESKIPEISLTDVSYYTQKSVESSLADNENPYSGSPDQPAWKPPPGKSYTTEQKIVILDSNGLPVINAEVWAISPYGDDGIFSFAVYTNSQRVAPLTISGHTTNVLIIITIPADMVVLQKEPRTETIKEQFSITTTREDVSPTITLRLPKRELYPDPDDYPVRTIFHLVDEQGQPLPNVWCDVYDEKALPYERPNFGTAAYKGLGFSDENGDFIHYQAQVGCWTLICTEYESTVATNTTHGDVLIKYPFCIEDAENPSEFYVVIPTN